MSSAYDMHANWRQVDPRAVLRRCRANGGTIVPYARIPGNRVSRGIRSWIVTWQDRGEDGKDWPLEGHLYVVRCQSLRVERDETEDTEEG